jgi:hypothetical protein
VVVSAGGSYGAGSGDGFAVGESGPVAPHPVRIYDYLLGGKDNYAADREAADRMVRALPNVREAARANRAFLVRAVRFMAGSGIRQFLDLGTGLPTSPNVHEVAREFALDARVAYVDNEPVVTVYNRALRSPDPQVVATQQDLREPARVLGDPVVLEVIDLAEPVGLLLVAVLHFVDQHTAPAVVDEYVQSLAAGSMVAISAACAEDQDAQEVARIRAVYAGSRSSFVFHTPDQFARLFSGLELCEPGIVEVSRWRDGGPALAHAGMSFLAAVGRKT